MLWSSANKGHEFAGSKANGGANLIEHSFPVWSASSFLPPKAGCIFEEPGM
jgi:hypothetical protein